MSVQERLRATLTERAVGPVDTSRLLTGSVARGKRRRLRHNGGTALVALAVLAVLAAVPIALSNRSGGPDGHIAGEPTVASSPTSTPSPGSTLPMPPVVPDAVTVLRDPKVLGSDASLLHLSFDGSRPWPDLPGGASDTVWASYDGDEYLTVNAPFFVSFSVGTHAAYNTRGLAVEAEPTVGGKSAKIFRREDGDAHSVYGGPSGSLTMVLWEPVPGVPAMAEARGRTDAELVSLAERLRFDRVSRCVVGFEVVNVPAGVTLSKCDTGFASSGVEPGGNLRYRKADGSRFEIQISEFRNGRRPSNFPSGTPSVTIDGNPGYWQADSGPQGVGGKGERLYLYLPDNRFIWVFVDGTVTRQQAEKAVTTMHR